MCYERGGGERRLGEKEKKKKQGEKGKSTEPEFVNVKEPRNRFQGIFSAPAYVAVRDGSTNTGLSYRPARLGIDSWAP